MFGKENMSPDDLRRRNELMRSNPRPQHMPKRPGYLNVDDLRPSTDRAKIYDPASGLVISFDGQVSFADSLVKEALGGNTQRAQLVFVAVTPGPFWVRFGGEGKEGFGYPLIGIGANFERSAKVSYIHKGGINVVAAASDDLLYILEASYPGMETGVAEPFRQSPGGIDKIDGGEGQRE